MAVTASKKLRRLLPSTWLGATGSIGSSTVDLLKGERERYRVEAVTFTAPVKSELAMPMTSVRPNPRTSSEPKK